MRILVIQNMYPPHHLGGYELSCRDVVERWRARGHTVQVLTSDMRLDGVTSDADREVSRTLRFYWDDHKLLSPPFRERLRIERHNQKRLQAVLDDIRPDVVSAWNMGAMSLGLLTTVAERKIPLVCVVCDDWLIYAHDLDAWTRTFRKLPLVGGIMRPALGVPTRWAPDPDTAVCFISETVRRRAEEHAPWIPKRWTIAYNGIDPVDFPIREPAPKAWAGRLLYAGRVEERKGVHVAIDALAQLPAQTMLTIDGPGDASYFERLRAQVTSLRLDDRVRFQVSSRTDLAQCYADANAVVFPVLWEEPFGLVPLEAMASATPVVATGMGGSSEFLIDSVNCLLSAPGDAGALAGAITRLADDDQLRSRIVKAGQVTAGHIDVDSYTDTLEAWHAAAANRFAEGEPKPRTSLEELLAPLRR